MKTKSQPPSGRVSAQTLPPCASMVAQALADEGQEGAELLGGIVPVDQTEMLSLSEGQHLCH